MEHYTSRAVMINRITPHGVGILVDSNTNKSIINFVPLSERVMMLQLQTTKVRMNILQVYAPTSASEDREIEEFYEQIEQLLRNIKKHNGGFECQN